MTNKQTCLYCAKSYARSAFYSHRNPLINEEFGFCKKCVRSNIDLDDMDTLYDFLKAMDIPYLKGFWKKAVESKNETIGVYLGSMSLNQNVDKRFKDGESIVGKSSNTELAYNDDFEITDEVMRRWGRNLEVDDYIFLEDEFRNIGGFEAEDTIQERILKNMAKTQWMANKAYEEDDHTKYEKMMKILSSQMNDANIKPVQLKNSAVGNSLQSWGEWVRLVEETEPIDELSEEFKDSKFVSKYINRFFFTQMLRVFGKINDSDIEKLEGEPDD